MTEIRKRSLKNDMYHNEQIIIKNTLCEILKINNETNYFYLYDIDNDVNMQQNIINLKDDIKKYFSCSQWTCFKEKNIKREYLTIIKCVFKYTGITLIPTGVFIKRNENKLKTQKYIINI